MNLSGFVCLTSIKGVERRTENMKPDEDPSGWPAYHTFLGTLREKYLKNEAPKGTAVLQILLSLKCFFPPWRIQGM